MTALTDRIAEVLRREMPYDVPPTVIIEKSRRIAERIVEALHLTEEWAIEFTDSLDNAPDRYEILDDEPSKEVVDRCRSFPHRGIAHRLVSPWLAAERIP